MKSVTKTYFKVIGASVAAIIAFWLLDALVDVLVHFDGPLDKNLFLNAKEVTFRSLFSVCFLIFGIFMAHVLSKQKHLEAELVHREKYLQSIIAEAADCVMLIAPDCSVIDMNPAGISMMDGYKRENIIGGKLCPFISPEYADCFRSFVETVCSGKTDTFTYRTTGPEGNSRWLEAKGVPFHDGDNKRTLMLAVTRDVTEGKMAEQVLLESYERFTTVLEGLDAVVSVADLDTYEVLFINQFTQNLFGDVVGQPCWKVFQSGLSGPCPSCSNDRIVDYKGEPAEPIAKETYSTLNGRWYSINERAIRWVDGRVVRLDIATDITERKKAEETIRQSLEEKEMLLKEIHHRVKNNLAVVQSLLKLQSSQLADEKSKELLKESQSRIQSMSMIHEQLHTTDDLSGINISDYIDNMVRKLFHTYKVNTSQIELLIEVPETTIDIDVLVPLGLVINELITNALKYAFPDNRSGKLMISLLERKNDEYVLSIKDNGVGMPVGLDINESKSLGMTIVSSLTKQIRGKLEVLRDQGTEFKIIFQGNPFT